MYTGWGKMGTQTVTIGAKYCVKPMHDSNEEEAKKESEAKDIFLHCKWSGCQSRFRDGESLYRHVCDEHIVNRRHAGKKKLKVGLPMCCLWEDCRKCVQKRDHLTSHVRVHINMWPFKCDLCGKKFRRRQDVKKHLNLHSEVFGAQKLTVLSKVDLVPAGKESNQTAKPTIVDKNDHSNRQLLTSKRGVSLSKKKGQKYNKPHPNGILKTQTHRSNSVSSLSSVSPSSNTPHSSKKHGFNISPEGLKVATICGASSTDCQPGIIKQDLLLPSSPVISANHECPESEVSDNQDMDKTSSDNLKSPPLALLSLKTYPSLGVASLKLSLNNVSHQKSFATPEIQSLREIDIHKENKKLELHQQLSYSQPSESNESPDRNASSRNYSKPYDYNNEAVFDDKLAYCKEECFDEKLSYEDYQCYSEPARVYGKQTASNQETIYNDQSGYSETGRTTEQVNSNASANYNRQTSYNYPGNYNNGQVNFNEESTYTQEPEYIEGSNYNDVLSFLGDFHYPERHASSDQNQMNLHDSNYVYQHSQRHLHHHTHQHAHIDWNHSIPLPIADSRTTAGSEFNEESNKRGSHNPRGLKTNYLITNYESNSLCSLKSLSTPTDFYCFPAKFVSEQDENQMGMSSSYTSFINKPSDNSKIDHGGISIINRHNSEPFVQYIDEVRIPNGQNPWDVNLELSLETATLQSSDVTDTHIDLHPVNQCVSETYYCDDQFLRGQCPGVLDRISDLELVQDCEIKQNHHQLSSHLHHTSVPHFNPIEISYCEHSID